MKALAKLHIYPKVLDPGDFSPAPDVSRFVSQTPLVLLPDSEHISPPQQEFLLHYLKKRGKIGTQFILSPALAQAMKMPDRIKFTAVKTSLTGVFDIREKSFHQSNGAYLAILPTAKYEAKTTGWWQNRQGNTNLPALLENSSGFWLNQRYLHQDATNGSLFLYSLLHRHLPKNLISKLPVLPKRETTISIQKVPPAISNEMRAAWCAHPQSINNWNHALSRMQDSSINCLFLYMGFAGQDGNSPPLPFRNFISSAHQHGIQIHGWFNLLSATDASPVWLKNAEKAGRLQKNADGKTIPWLCPLHPENRALILRKIQNARLQYQFDGIQLDMVRYPQPDSCCCSRCRTAFLKQLSKDQATARYKQQATQNWRNTVTASTAPLHQEWNHFRRSVINILVMECARQLLPNQSVAKGSFTISAAVFPDWPYCRDRVGQDWQLWLERRWIDFAFPMTYTESPASLAALLRNYEKFRSRTFPAIGITEKQLSPHDITAQANEIRKAKFPGFILFELGNREIKDILPQKPF